ncbi:Serine/threonine-protein kinase AFC1 [Acorus calamus]|uniref:Serine/threonine-protein kinase PRP4 homolog n=1 Tax=Acorus calamus TaxID=4465 RepID=A0AAV9DGC3_ACOCL|nr:Serine/threonine-protein kinase AFC1 [Acorus calamus]
MGGSDELSHKRHRRVSSSAAEDGVDEASKRRKHRHHHHHHHHHRHRESGKRDLDKSEFEEPEGELLPVSLSASVVVADDEREEGEILEEEERRGGGPVEGVSDVDNYPAKEPVIGMDDDKRLEPVYHPRECSDRKDRKPIGKLSECGGDALKSPQEGNVRDAASVSPKHAAKEMDCSDAEVDELKRRERKHDKRKDSDLGRSGSREHYDRRKESRSPPLNQFHNDVVRSRSRSYERMREKRSRSRDDRLNRGIDVWRHDRGERSYGGNGDRDRYSESRDVVKRDSDHEKVGRYDRVDRHDSRNRERDAEVDKSVTRERERSRLGSWSDRESVRDRERLKDRERHRVKEREREKETYEDRDRDRDRAMNRDRDRDLDKQMYKDRRSRSDKYNIAQDVHDDRDRHKNPTRRTRLNDLTIMDDSTRPHLDEDYEKSMREEDDQDDNLEVALELRNQEEEEIDRIKEESRKRRQAILEKYKQKQLEEQAEPSASDSGKEEKLSMIENEEEKIFPSKSANSSRQASPMGIENEPYSSDIYNADPSFTVEKPPAENGTLALDQTTGAGVLGEGTPKSEKSADMFYDDIFGESPAGLRRLGKGDGLQIERSGLHDNWDDAEGYYSYRFGELLDGRYEVIAAHGKGVFSTVVRAKDLKPGKDGPEEVAIKIIRNNETMYKAGLEELVILKKLAAADPEDKRHCVRFISNFKYRNHLCLVFESLHMNLREVLKKFGRNVGLSLTGVRVYAKQLFIALKHLRNCGVLHCDIKPDNMLVNEAKNVLKLCDFGNAMFSGKNEITPYLVSRFYRAPEIILGLPYDHPLDIWSVGCCLFELYAGKVLFPGPSNNDMLRLHMELKGPFPKKMLRKGAFTDQHFDQDLNFHAVEEDPVTKKIIKRLIVNIKPKDIGALFPNSAGEDPKMVSNFKDLLERIFILDPEKRMSVSQALMHPFITGK